MPARRPATLQARAPGPQAGAAIAHRRVKAIDHAQLSQLAFYAATATALFAIALGVLAGLQTTRSPQATFRDGLQATALLAAAVITKLKPFSGCLSLVTFLFLTLTFVSPSAASPCPHRPRTG